MLLQDTVVIFNPTLTCHGVVLVHPDVRKLTERDTILPDRDTVLNLLRYFGYFSLEFLFRLCVYDLSDIASIGLFAKNKIPTSSGRRPHAYRISDPRMLVPSRPML